jgi:hypothetical protein
LSLVGAEIPDFKVFELPYNRASGGKNHVFRVSWY